jgi:uncharacterized protein YcfL
MKKIVWLICLLCGLSLTALAATEKRVALVIGNDAYQGVPKLEKAANDARAIGKELEKVGFEVMSHTNLDRRGMNQAINAFTEKISGGGVGVFFFAGHGVQLDGRNFLLPVDIKVDKPNDLDDEAIDMLKVTERLNDAKAKLSLLIIDACRDNPFPKKAGRSLGGTRGLSMPQTPNGTMVVYSAGVNQQALDKLSDGDKSPNGLFTREFLPVISTPGIRIDDAVKRVRSAVIQKAKSVGHEQNPAIYDQTDGDFYFVPTLQGNHAGTQTAGAPAAVMVQAVDPMAVELSFWDSIKASTDAGDFLAYLDKYPNGQYAALARNRIAALDKGARGRSTEPEHVAQPAARLVSAPPAAAPSGSGSIASKIEEMGVMTHLKISGLRAARRNGLLSIQAEVTNSSHENQQIFYRVKWLDNAGFSVWDDEPWKPVLVYGKQKQLLTLVAPTPQATDFRLVLQSPENKADDNASSAPFP